MSIAHHGASIALALVAAAAAPARPAAADDYFFGMLHSERGQATLQPNPDGTLTIDDIGPSGLDGVSITAGNLASFEVGLDFGPAGALPAGAQVTVYSPPPEWCTACRSGVDVFETGGGSAGVGYVSDGLAPQCVRVELRLAGAVVDVQTYGLPLPPVLASGDLGSSGADGLIVRVSYDEMTVLAPAPQMIALDGSAAGPVLADAVDVLAEGLPPGKPVQRDLQLILEGRNLPDGLRVTHEGLRLVDPVNGACCRQGRALGLAHMEAEVGEDLCLALPEHCADIDGAPGLPNGLRISNLGSSGDDGVSIIVDDDDESDDDYDDEVILRVTPSDVSGGSLHLSATGTIDGMPGQALGTASLVASGGQVEVHADFTAVGSSDVQVEVRDQGAIVASFPRPGGPAAVLGTLTGGPGGLNVNKCGKLGGPFQPPCFTVCTAEPFTFDAGAIGSFVGDDLRLLASPFGTVSAIERFDMLLSGPPEVTLAVAPPSAAPDVIVAGGLPVTGLGNASMSLDPEGHLTVGNIGSSGLDGVSIDLGPCEGGSLTCADCALGPDASVTFDIYDDQCPSCPTPTLARVTMATNPAGEVVVSPEFPNCPTTITVTVLDQQGNPLGSFTLASGATFTVVTPDPGDTMSMKRSSHRKSRPHGSGDLPDPLVYLTLVSLTSSSASGDVTVVDPSQTAYPNAGGFALRTGECTPAEEPLATRMCLTAANVPSLTIDAIGLVQNGLEHRAVDGARLAGETICEPETGAPVGRLRISNLGSSGTDGVEINYLDVDDDGDSLPDFGIVGTSFVLDATNSQDDAAMQTYSWRQLGGPTGVLAQQLGRADLTIAGGERAISVVEPAWLSPAVMDVEILDASDEVLDQQTGLAVGTAAFLDTTRLPGRYEFEVIVTDAGDGAIEPRTVLKTYFETGTARISGGMPQPSGASVRVTVRSTGGASGEPVFLAAGELLASSSAPTPGQMVITEEGVNAAPPLPCAADLDGSGDVGFGDILEVIGAWGPCPAPPAGCPQDLSGNGAVDFADILAVIGGWGPCPI